MDVFITQSCKDEKGNEGVAVVTSEAGHKRMRKGKRYSARKEKVVEHDDKESQAEHFQKDAATTQVAALNKASHLKDS